MTDRERDEHAKQQQQYVPHPDAVEPEIIVGHPGDAPATPAVVAATTAESTEKPEKPTFLSALRQEFWADNTLTVTLLAIVLAMLFGGLLMIIGNAGLRQQWSYFFYQPGTTLSATLSFIGESYGALFKGSIVDPDVVNRWIWGVPRVPGGPVVTWQDTLYPISETLTYAGPLILTGLAVAVPFRAGLFNIGGQGQSIMGAIAGGTVGFALSLPTVLHVLTAIVAGAIAGGLYGYIVGLLKARTGAHEVIVTIMLNYIAIYFLSWYIIQKGIKQPNIPDAISKSAAETARLPHIFDPSLRANLGIVLALLAAAGVAWLLKRGTFGFELRAVGYNPDAARTAGIKVGATLALTMALSGALAGLGGTVAALGSGVPYAITNDVVGAIGFNGILVALLGRVRPWGVVAAGLLFGALQAGGKTLQATTGVSEQLVTVVQALIVIFVAAPILVKAIFRLRKSPTVAAHAGLAKG